jgi:tetratricopeptide (TPR) repeat protein
MPSPSPHPELHRAENLLIECHFREALAIVLHVEEQDTLSPVDNLYCMWLKLNIRGSQEALVDLVTLGEKVYQESRAQGNLFFQFESLYWKFIAVILFRKLKDCVQYIEQFNELYKQYGDQFQQEEKFLVDMFYTSFQLMNNFVQGDYDGYLEKLIQISRTLESKPKYKRYLGLYYATIAQEYQKRGELQQAWKYLQLCSDLGYQFYMLYLKLGNYYTYQGDLHLALKNIQQCLKMAQEDNCPWGSMAASSLLALLYYKKAEYAYALQYERQALQIGVDIGELHNRGVLLLSLVKISLEMGDLETAHQYFASFKELGEDVDEIINTDHYRFAHALILKKSTRSRDRVKAEIILRQLLDGNINMHIEASIELCDLLLDELYQTGDEEIVEEITPLIQPLMEFASKQNTFSILAEAHLLQGRVALIQLNFDEAQHCLTQAQKIAEEHDLQRLAQQISAEHDTLLHELDIWENLKQTQAPLQKRLEMASTDSILRRMQGKLSVDPPEMEEELPLLVIIMLSGGIPCFVHPFSDAWGVQEDMFSGFLSAVNSWGTGMFAQSIDRLGFGDNTILVNSLDPFTVCYVIQGQSYPAQQKLTRFVTAIKSQTVIWDALLKSNTTSLILDAGNTPALGTLVSEIFRKG